MSFKTHLLIVSVIIMVIYLIWDWSRSGPEPAAAVDNGQPSYTITVNHASWGLNCPVIVGNVLDKAYEKKAASEEAQHPKMDNALQIVSGICNGSPTCLITVSDETFPDMAPPDCTDKKLEIEYRCFSYDRPWHAEANSATGMLTLDCSDKAPK